MQLKYNLNDKPPVIHTLLYGLQWLVIAIPNVVTIGMLANCNSATTSRCRHPICSRSTSCLD